MEQMITTPRLRLPPFSQRHLTRRYVGWLNDPETVRYSEQRHRQHTLPGCRAYWKSFKGTSNYFWAIESLDPALGHIGNMNAYVDLRNGVADVGIIIGEKAARGQGLALEAWLAVCEFLFGHVGVRKITAGMLAGNRAMCRLARRAGMRRDGRRKEQYLFNGRPMDIVHVALFRDEWKSSRSSASWRRGKAAT
jgi:[ribosomal protein S5]-alanine N-acetyltransferase